MVKGGGAGNKFMKKRTKRETCSHRYKIIKKVNEHNRKLKKDKKKNPQRYRKKASDPGVPNSLPFKDIILAEAAEAKQRAEDARQKRREEAMIRRKELRGQKVDAKRNINIGNITTFIEDARQRGNEFEDKQETNAGTQGELTDKSAKAYYREFKKVVEAADVVLEVLDARDPIGTRCPQMEEAVRACPGKKLVLVLNKADLVPRDNLEKWLKALREELPTVVFKASTQNQGARLGQAKKDILKATEEDMNSSKCLGADVLLQLLKNYCRNKDIKTAIAVGVVGLPNVGKSSLINSLKRSKSCGVGATPGFTKTMQEIVLDSKVRLLDCPGIILPGGDTSNDATAALRNAVKLEQLEDPITPIEAILARADKQQLMLHYRIAEFNETQEFLSLLCKRMGKLKKGGVPDYNTAARAVLHDWNIGNIKYYTSPPVVKETSATLLTSLAPEFDIDSLMDTESSLMAELPQLRPSETMVVKSAGLLTDVREQNSDDDTDDEEEDSDNDVLASNIKIAMDTKENNNGEEPEKKARWETEAPDFDPSTMSLKKFQKKNQKKTRKEGNRNIKRTDELTDAFTNFKGLKDKDDDYDFNDFDK